MDFSFPFSLSFALGVLPYPQLDPVALQLGPLAVRWYALAYLLGVLLAWWLLRRVAFAAATGGARGSISRMIEAFDRAAPAVGAGWTHAGETARSDTSPGSQAAERAQKQRAAKRAQRRRARHSGRRARSRDRRRAQSEQRAREEKNKSDKVRSRQEEQWKEQLRGSSRKDEGVSGRDTGMKTDSSTHKMYETRAQKKTQRNQEVPIRWSFIPPAAVDEFVTWSIFGVLIGGRLGYVLMYNFDYFRAHPAEIAQLWLGGMSFHGGLIGLLLAGLIYCRWRRLPLLALCDLIAFGGTIGLFLGRIANFVNGELYGRASDVPWAMVFPAGGEAARHPSQLYEAAAEGLLLFVVLGLLVRAGALYRHGLVTATALIGYGTARFLLEFTREPDPQLGLLQWGLTAGQWLCLPMVIFGFLLLMVPTGRIHPVTI